MAGNAVSQSYAYGGMVPPMQGYGGVPAEVEGGEVLGMPGGGVYGVEGPPHEQGGVPAVLPEATKVYSDRVKVDGVTMADRKGKRKRKEVKLERLLEKYGTDSLLRNSFERTLQANAKEEEMDLAVQELVRKLEEEKARAEMPPLPDAEGQHYPMPPMMDDGGGYGGGMGDPAAQGGWNIPMDPLDTGGDAGGMDFGAMLPEQQPRDMTGAEFAYGTGPGGILPTEHYGMQVPNLKHDDEDYRFWRDTRFERTVPSIPIDERPLHYNTYVNRPPKYRPIPSVFFGGNGKHAKNEAFADDVYNNQPHIKGGKNIAENIGKALAATGGAVASGVGAMGKNAGMGDFLTLGGGLYNAFAPERNTIANRAGDTPNINTFRDFGRDALKSVDNSRAFAGQSRDMQMKDVERARTGLVQRGRQGARSANTARAMDLAAYAQAGQLRDRVADAFSRQMLQLSQQEAQLLNQRDQAVMAGEERRDRMDRMDRDAFYTQLAQDRANKGMGIQHLGKSLNQMRQRDAMMNLLGQMSKYGISVDADGNMIFNGVKGGDGDGDGATSATPTAPALAPAQAGASPTQPATAQTADGVARLVYDKPSYLPFLLPSYRQGFANGVKFPKEWPLEIQENSFLQRPKTNLLGGNGTMPRFTGTLPTKETSLKLKKR